MDEGERNELALFAGVGGGMLGTSLLGYKVVCAVERDRYCRSVLIRRQNEGHLEPFPIWDDVCTFNGRPWRGRIGLISGGFPCQDISSANSVKREGLSGVKSGLWVEMARIVSEVLPRRVFVENSPRLSVSGMGLGQVLGDLAQLGYHAAWGVLGAYQVGAPHKRDRIWILGVRMEDPDSQRREKQRPSQPAEKDRTGGQERSPCNAKRSGWWTLEPSMGRLADGLPYRVDRLRALGNAQVPIVAAHAFRQLELRLQRGGVR